MTNKQKYVTETIICQENVYGLGLTKAIGKKL
jgi:hypothetical protein